MTRYILLVVVFMSTTLPVFSDCDCWVSEFIDEWTDVKSVGLICMENESEAAIVLWAHETRGPIVAFHDPETRARNGVLVKWQYRVGTQPTQAAHHYWNIGNPPTLIGGGDHMKTLLSGIENRDRILFRSVNRDLGTTRTLQDCKDGVASVRIFKPILENIVETLQEAQSEQGDQSVTQSGYGERADRTLSEDEDGE